MGNFISTPGARKKEDRGASPELWAKACEMQAETRKRQEARKTELQSFLATFPEIDGFIVNRENGEVTDEIGNYITSVKVGDTPKSVFNRIKETFDCL